MLFSAWQQAPRGESLLPLEAEAMAVETRSVSFYSCDTESCDYAVYREVDADGLPAGYHGTVSQVDGDGKARGVDYFACTWDHTPSSIAGALNNRGTAVESDTVPDHHTKGEMPSGGGGRKALAGRRPLSDYESSYDHSGGSEALSFGPDGTLSGEGYHQE